MSLSSTKENLSGKIAIGEKVTVAGWIRTRRDSMAGFSFLAVNDGSGFEMSRLSLLIHLITMSLKF